MICYVHFRESNTELEAVAMCKNCGVGLCFEHFTELRTTRPGGMDYGCPHVLPEPAASNTGDTAGNRR